ncbi:MAG: YesU family protein [Spirochaetaceae bacterium]
MTNDEEFNKLLELNWSELFFDSGSEDWRKNWFLDGKKADLKNTDRGLDFYAGPTFRDDSCHAVLWTKEEYSGDLKIEYNFTRLDKEHRCVNILYLQATGCGEGPYEKDISKWNHLRQVPAMSEYFDHMNTYHISYAAFNNTDEIEPGYIRARRYMAAGLDATELEPDYDPTGFFEYDIPHKMTIIKSGDHIYFKISNEKKEQLCHWHNTKFPSINEGRIGLRQMFTRASRYGNFRISKLRK